MPEKVLLHFNVMMSNLSISMVAMHSLIASCDSSKIVLILLYNQQCFQMMLCITKLVPQRCKTRRTKRALMAH